MKKFTNYDKEMLEIFRDPVKWAEFHLGEKPRWYQQQILRHPHNRKVLRCGRRIGKCIEENQRILDPLTGEYLTVGELYQKQKDRDIRLVTLDAHYKIKPSQALHIEDNGVKETFLVRTKYGGEVVLTGNHPVLTVDGWVEVDALQIGDRIATPKILPYFGQQTMNSDQVKFYAYLIAGGNVSGSHVTFSCQSDEIGKDFQEVATRLGHRVIKQVHARNTYTVVPNSEKEKLLNLLHERKVPQEIFMLRREDVSLFLNRLYSVDGWVYGKSRPEIGYGTVSKQLAMDIKHLLLRFGIHAILQIKKQKYKDRIKQAYQLMILRKEDILSFGKEIGIFGKENALQEVMAKAEQMESMEYTIPKEVWKYIEEERKAKKMKKSQVAGGKEERLRTNLAPSESKVAVYAENLQSAFLYDLAHSDVIWEEVVAIESLGKRQTYDVSVPETHNLVVEDIFVHNTWTMTSHMLWVAFTCNGGTEIKKGATCLVATPYDTQAKEIFDQIRFFIDNSPVLQDSVKSITKNPYEIEFKNKSRIKLKTAGTRSGAEGSSLRGQKASWLYLDETDYMTDKDIETILAISFEAPKRIGVMMASTPTGKRGLFYKICTQLKFNQDVKLLPGNYYDLSTYDRDTADGWVEFHFPTMVNPEWDERMERELRQMYSQVAFEHEVLAEFGTEMVGVFNKDYVDEAASNGYVLHTQRMWPYPISIGVDWDKFGEATQIVVTQWNPHEPRRPRPDIDMGQPQYGRFQVINRIEIPKGEFTYDHAVKKLIELNDIYQPFAIYCDRGAGEKNCVVGGDLCFLIGTKKQRDCIRTDFLITKLHRSLVCTERP